MISTLYDYVQFPLSPYYVVGRPSKAMSAWTPDGRRLSDSKWIQSAKMMLPSGKY